MSSVLFDGYVPTKAVPLFRCRLCRRSLRTLRHFWLNYLTSMSAGHFPCIYKEAYITPIIKKPGLQVADVKSYIRISNVCVVLKHLEQWWPDRFQRTCSLPSWWQYFNMASVSAIPLRPPFCECCRTCWNPSMVVRRPPWLFLICRPPSTPSTRATSVVSCRQPLERVGLSLTSSAPICRVACSTYGTGRHVFRPSWSVAFRKALC